MTFVEAVAQTLVDVAKDDLVACQRYLMVDESHAIEIHTSIDTEGLVAIPVAAYLCGFHVVNFQTFRLAYIDNSFVKFFQLPA